MNRCDLASAKLALKAMGQENKRLLSKARGQVSRIRELEVHMVGGGVAEELLRLAKSDMGGVQGSTRGAFPEEAYVSAGETV